jgi:hypothetical protein
VLLPALGLLLVCSFPDYTGKQAPKHRHKTTI